jgi:U3 small nucleolar RNA-associated protein 18
LIGLEAADVGFLRRYSADTSTVHLPTCTVYKNWPTSGTPFGRISAVAMSPNSELLAVGNQQGKIRMWEIRG